MMKIVGKVEKWWVEMELRIITMFWDASHLVGVAYSLPARSLRHKSQAYPWNMTSDLTGR